MGKLCTLQGKIARLYTTQNIDAQECCTCQNTHCNLCSELHSALKGLVKRKSFKELILHVETRPMFSAIVEDGLGVHDDDIQCD